MSYGGRVGEDTDERRGWTRGQPVAVRSKGESRRDEDRNRRLVFVCLSRLT